MNDDEKNEKQARLMNWSELKHKQQCHYHRYSTEVEKFRTVNKVDTKMKRLYDSAKQENNKIEQELNLLSNDKVIVLII